MNFDSPLIVIVLTVKISIVHFSCLFNSSLLLRIVDINFSFVFPTICQKLSILLSQKTNFPLTYNVVPGVTLIQTLSIFVHFFDLILEGKGRGMGSEGEGGGPQGSIWLHNCQSRTVWILCYHLV